MAQKKSSAKGIKLSAAQVKKAKACLEKSGRVKISFKEISTTRLPTSIRPVSVFID